MKIAIALAAALLLSVAPATAQEAAPSTTSTVDQSKLSPNMQSFMSKVDAMRARRQARESETTGRVLPPGDPIGSKGWHKAQGHKRVNWSGAGGSSARRRAKRADAGSKSETKAEDKKDDAKAEKKDK